MGGFFWFGVGVLTAWTYTHHKEMENRWGWGNGEHRHQCGSWSRGFEGRRAYPGGPSYRQEPYPDAPHPPAEKAPAGVPYQAQEAHPMMQQQHWEELQVLRRQAGERMTEMSEATIDSLVAGLQGLKARIAEHREQQERTAQRSPHGAQSLSLPASQQLGESRLV